ncbi:SgcJ/EcaC family oxidoreductase [Micromonospora sp. NPDC050686]|uniref:SgcJ/EcaC family oxidoreductase n=1 Tax=Micromonospora sp. NPDC050686 TaxID=3154631 RepID=UPI0033F8CCCF
MTEKAASLVESAKQWATYYGGYPNGEKGAAYTAALRVRAAWDANDADAFADMFVENGSMLVGDRQLSNREEIRSYMAEAFSGPYQGSTLTEEPIEIRLLNDTVALAVTDGGIIPRGANAVDPANLVRGTWIIRKTDRDWRIVSRQTSPIKG